MIMQALEVYEKERLDTLELESRPLGNLGNFILQKMGEKAAKPQWVNEFSLYKKAHEVRAVLPKEGCKTYLALDKRNLIPDWVSKLVDFESIELAAM